MVQCAGSLNELQWVFGKIIENGNESLLLPDQQTIICHYAHNKSPISLDTEELQARMHRQQHKQGVIEN